MEELLNRPICAKTNPTEEELQVSNKADIKISKKFHCVYCKKVLSSKQNLKEHEFIHTGELPYICKNFGCGMKFRQGSVLSAHKRIHNIIEKYANQDKYTWVKLTDLVNGFNGEKTMVLEKNVEKIEIPLINTPQAFLITRNFNDFEL
ncbi:hypothetical protein SteCoe_32505 [Stentor coeruleus]|uniref:C2H2-type domain-containing protein n=1 Tax=Stentor coeruleus TaxID=5963 RepID=A0A1R2AYW1_9CILI|nr:hypothetical protein SteCoe_32505 [Stentor coeruleus]